jgi:stearoyl-CoA desaturase (delta-9 desaturase)
MSARLIWMFEKVGWVKEVRWPVAERIQAKLVSAQPVVKAA